MSTIISQRELRNDNADIMRRVEAGEEFIVTRNGRPIAKVIPLEDLPEGTRRMTLGEIEKGWASSGFNYDAEAWLRDIREMRESLADDRLDEDPWLPRS
ncbi:hypothetical protein BH10ACT7_BH10ACT7_01190 [soil metagenome]